MRNRITVTRSLVMAAVLLFCVSASFSQYVYDYKKSADNFYAKGNYFSAAQYYEKYLGQMDNPVAGGAQPYTIHQKGKKKAKLQKDNASYNDIVYRIAESYRMMNDYAHAEKWYGDASKFPATQYPQAVYWYGVSLRANGKYGDAQTQFEQYLSVNKQNDAYTSQAKIELANVKFINEQMNRKDASMYTVNRFIGTGNNKEANYAATVSNNQIIFTSTRPDSMALKSKSKNPYINTLYQTSGGGTSAEKINIPMMDNMEQGVADISADGNWMFLTRWVKKSGGNLASIYVSRNTNGQWSDPVKLSDQVNVDGFSSQQPFITSDSKYLLFASDRPGGQGKFDLWYAPLSNGTPGKAVNLSAINTKEDDEAPFYYAPEGTLVFATKGRVGMGGFDLFSAKGSVGSSWAAPQNLGAPVNSSKDDIYFYTKGNGRILADAMFSSDRASECCLELYTLSKVYRNYVTGVVVDCKTNQPIAGAGVTLSKEGKSTTTGSDGSYMFDLSSFDQLDLSASKDQYQPGTLHVTREMSGPDTVYNVALCLTPVPVVIEEPKKEKRVYFDFAKYDLRAETQRVLDTLASILQREPNLSMDIIGYTDHKGSDPLNDKLSKNRAEACKEYLVAKGISPARLSATGKGKYPSAKEITPDGKDDPAARQESRRVEFEIKLKM